MRMPISRSHLRAFLVLIALAVIALFLFLFRRQITPASVPGPTVVETVNRGLSPADEQTFRAKLADLLAQQEKNKTDGTRDINLLLRIGVQYYILGEVKHAADSYRDIISTNPNDPAALENLGQALQEMGDYAGALEAWQRAVNAAPTESTYLRIVDLIDAHLPEYKDRIPAVVEHGIANLGQTYGFLIRLGDWYAGQGDYVRAVSHYEVALRLSENSDARETLETYRQKMREAEAAGK